MADIYIMYGGSDGKRDGKNPPKPAANYPADAPKGEQ